MMFGTRPRTITNAASAGPVTSWRVLQAKASALGVEVTVGESIRLDGVSYGTLSAAEVVLDAIAAHRGVDLAPALAAAREAVAAARAAALARLDDRASQAVRSRFNP
jgi:hypothetical protein